MVSVADSAIRGELDRNGYAVVHGVVDPQRAELVRCSLERRFRGPGHGRLTNAWTRVPEVRELAVGPDLLDIATEALGAPAVAFQTLDFMVGTGQPPHADTIHFDTVPSGGVCALWIALEAVHLDQGPVEVYPGSHRWAVETPDTLGLDPMAFDVGAYEAVIARRIEENRTPPHPVEMDIGDVLVWSANLVHGGAAKAEGTTRWSQATHYVRAGEVLVTPMHSFIGLRRFEVRTVVDIATGRTMVPDRTAPPVLHRPGRVLSSVGSEHAGVGARRMSEAVGLWRGLRTRLALAASSRREPVQT